MTLSEIWIYPVKSLGGIRLAEAEVEEKGLKYDRRWMIVDENGMFVTQRILHKMALIDVELLSFGLILSYRPEENNTIFVPFQSISAISVSVTIWDDETDALTVSDEVDKWLSNLLKKNVRLVMMPESTHRKADPRYAKNEENVSFADGYPFLIISQASLDHLNTRLPEPIEMKRFRPNFVVTNTAAHEEDEWKSIQIGHVHFDIVKPCARCILTTINPETGEKSAEPLKTLATYRKINNKIMFGQNVVAKDYGKVSQGDTLTVL